MSGSEGMSFRIRTSNGCVAHLGHIEKNDWYGARQLLSHANQTLERAFLTCQKSLFGTFLDVPGC